MNYKKYYIIGILAVLFIGINNLQAQQTIPAPYQQQPTLLVTGDKMSDTNERLEDYKKNDRFGIGMTITAMGIGCLGLVGLYLLFNIIGSWGLSAIHNRAMKIYGMSKEEAKDISKQSGEVYAAIAMAIYEATEMHDEENTILTIRNTVRNYSPWSSKIYSLREVPKK